MRIIAFVSDDICSSADRLVETDGVVNLHARSLRRGCVQGGMGRYLQGSRLRVRILALVRDRARNRLQ